MGTEGENDISSLVQFETKTQLNKRNRERKGTTGVGRKQV